MKKELEKAISQGLEIPSEIKESEKNYYHVLILDSKFNQTTLEVTHKVRTVIYNDRSWIAIEDKLKRAGYGNIAVLHNPTIVVEEADSNADGKVSYTEIQAKAKELSELLDEEIKLNAKYAELEAYVEEATERFNNLEK